MKGHVSQIVLIVLGGVVSVLLGVFYYRELFPEYKIYQERYVALEEFRSSYTHEPAPPFEYGVKQIVIEREDRGPPVVDRCISCHVALEVPAFSPTRLVKDVAGHVVRDSFGRAAEEPNPEYVWARLDQTIAELRDPEILKRLSPQEQQSRLQLAEQDASLQWVQVGEHHYDVKKVLVMHPLIGNETRPFELHPLPEYGCVSCHQGNGQGLTTDRAHGPVWDGQYEKEYLGPQPTFLDQDPSHDPPFSRVFNGKPGERLLFQTTPLFPGALMEAKCVQCHEASHLSLEDQRREKKRSLVPHYLAGEQLYVINGCYACHRIAGLFRGGVGPDLTAVGKGYPWEIKQKIAWPQGNLPTSTMPNLRLDHAPLEKLMTFLLAQTGRFYAVGRTQRAAALKAWEQGEKVMLERPVPAERIDDLSFGMQVFATEGCASCHRLEGYRSQVHLRGEQDTQWFRSLFPEVVHYGYYDEQLPGSELVKTIETHRDEIEAHLAIEEESGLLDHLERDHEGLLENFYSNFAFAMRAKDDRPWREREQWRALVMRVLKTYVQVYGLGRLVGPHLNWSGVYRTDEWLMEHFKNPSGHVPRSLMPAFPFDTTKFLALTKMLDQLGKQNRERLHRLWDEGGFDPKSAYQMLCAQCHGIERTGDGAIAEWIYPIPKNLQNPEFLRNLTKEKALRSIVYGVAGTPMAPWGVGKEKDESPDAVLRPAEAKRLVDWLFASLPGQELIPEKEGVPKWNYNAEDAVKELGKHQGVSAIFKQEPPGPGQTRNQYFLRQELYTPEAVAAGENFFLMNCAVCHGPEASGMGLRSGVMLDAKPRALTNLDWLDAHDDLRLLQSIKYGVPGTSMTPWGDTTNGVQRIQLVMFIRSLSDENKKRRSLEETIYKAFSMAILALEQKKGEVEQGQEARSLKIRELQETRELLESELEAGESTAAPLQQVYAQEVEEKRQRQLVRERSFKIDQTIASLAEQRKLWENLGKAFLFASPSQNEWENYLSMVKSLGVEPEGLMGALGASKREEFDQARSLLLRDLAARKDELVQMQEQVMGKLPSLERQREWEKIHQQQQRLEKIVAQLVSESAQGLRLREELGK